MSTAALRRPVDASAAGIMVLLCVLWGFTYVFTKLAAPDISLVMQGGLRSVFAVVLLWLWTRMRGIALFERDGTLGAGLVAGALFAGEFLFISPAWHTPALRAWWCSSTSRPASRRSVCTGWCPASAWIGRNGSAYGWRSPAWRWLSSMALPPIVPRCWAMPSA